APLVHEARERGAIDRWFFLRYDEGGHHLRVRLHGRPDRLASEILPRLHAACAPLLATSRVANLVLDTYVPEVERYGGSETSLALAEAIFAADSDAVLALVALTPEGSETPRWKVALPGLERILEDFALTLDERVAMLTAARDGIRSVVGAGPTLDRWLGQLYRERTKDVSALVAPRDGAVLAILARRSAAMAPAVRGRRGLGASRDRSTPPTARVGSFVPMFVNRLMRSAPNAYEVTLYDFLARHTQSKRARAKAAPA